MLHEHAKPSTPDPACNVHEHAKPSTPDPACNVHEHAKPVTPDPACNVHEHAKPVTPDPSGYLMKDDDVQGDSFQQLEDIGSHGNQVICHYRDIGYIPTVLRSHSQSVLAMATCTHLH